MAELSDVQRIIVDRGVTHIVTQSDGLWTFTLCGSMMTGEAWEPWPLKCRICRKCRKRLKLATVSTNEPKEKSYGPAS